MKLVEIIFNFHGTLKEVQIYPENNFNRYIYSVDINGKHSFTLAMNEEGGLEVIHECDSIVPVEDSLLTMILKQLKWELNHAAYGKCF